MSETLWGVVIGALAAILGGVIGDLVGYQLQNKRERRNEMISAYELAEKCLIVGCSGYKYNYISFEEQMKLIDEVYIKTELYAKKEVYALFDKLSHYLYKIEDANNEEYEEMSKELIRLMRKDLGIKD